MTYHSMRTSWHRPYVPATEAGVGLQHTLPHLASYKLLFTVFSHAIHLSTSDLASEPSLSSVPISYRFSISSKAAPLVRPWWGSKCTSKPIPSNRLWIPDDSGSWLVGASKEMCPSLGVYTSKASSGHNVEENRPSVETDA